MNNEEFSMSTQEQVAAGISAIVELHESGYDDPCGLSYDADAIANASFNYGVSLAIDAAVAACVGIPATGSPEHLVMINLINELKALQIPK
jgi:hypothetical protein